MKKLLFALVAVSTMLLSCNDDEGYSVGFSVLRPTSVYTFYYANNTSDTLIIGGYGDWYIRTQQEPAGWCNLSRTSGNAGMLYKIDVRFDQNTTGKMRQAVYYAIDSLHPGDGQAAWSYIQYATRGDGAMGFAADVKEISGSDGSLIRLAYDKLHRPINYEQQLNGSIERQINLLWNDRDSSLTVTDNGKMMTASYGKDYQPGTIVGGGDTICYKSHYYNGAYAIDPSRVFSVVESKASGLRTGYTTQLDGPAHPKGQPLQADSIHNADSLRYWTANTAGITTYIEKYGLTYSQKDNRCQTIDANQLILGTDKMNPYLLMSLFRFARNSNIVSEANGESGKITVETETDGTGKVVRMKVKKGEQETEYSFN